MQKLISKFSAFLFMFFLGHYAIAQETSSTLSGGVKDDKGSPVAGASITIIYEPTGYLTIAQTNKKGFFNIPNLKPGGPYTVKVSFVGFKDEEYKDVNLGLGNNPEVTVALQSTATELKEVTVKSTSAKKNVGGTVVGIKQLTTLPTIGRSLSDFTRLTPQSNNNSFAGSNFRYNNLTVDGAINNDAIGFSNSFGGVSGGGQSGAAGSGTRTNPYSLDVIQEVQVQLAPYDVKLGNFTGGSVNAVTKSGSNDFHGSVYFFGRNQNFVGKSVDGLKTSIGDHFYEYQPGVTLSGPIVKNKAFFIVNYEYSRRHEPTFYNIGDSGAAIKQSEAAAIYSRLINQYNYDPGSYNGAYVLNTNSDKVFARLDFNLNKQNTLTLRGIYTHGWGNNLERTSNNFQFGSTDFTQHTKNFNVVAELKTKVSADVNNQFTASYINVHEYRDYPGALSPFVDIDNGRIWLGTWREASIYNMKQQTLEISDNLTINKGINKFTIGTHNEFYDLTYGFINSWNGRWEYSGGVNSFLNDNPSRIRGAFSTNTVKLPNSREAIFNNPPNQFTVGLLSVYAQDELKLSSNFKFTPGIRIDYAAAGSQPGVDTALNTTNSSPKYVSSNPTYSNTPFSQLGNSWLGNAIVSPRISFSYDVIGNQSLIIRGGSGIFTGRVPFAWMGYGYTLNGSTYGNIDWNSIKAGTKVPIAINPYGLKDTVTKYGGASRSSTREVDVVDNNFKLPTVLRSSLTIDYKFGNGFKAMVDVLYTKTLQDIKFEQINLKDSVAYYSGSNVTTPVFVGGKYNSQYSNVYFLTNTQEGYRYNITGSISKNTPNISIGSHSLDVNISLAYTYGYSKDVSNGIRNSWESNFNLNPTINPNNSQLAFSNFDLRHRIVGVVGTSWKWTPSNTTNLAFVYSGQSGNPYSVIYQSAPFSNGSSAPLPYIPKDATDINLADIKDKSGNVTYTATQQGIDLMNFINNDDYLKTRKGQYAERNGLRTPWVNDLDMKIMHEFKLSKSNKYQAIQVSIDMTNVLNFINNDWGLVNFVSNINNYTVNFLKFATDANGKAAGAPSTGYNPTFNFVKPNGIGGHYYTLDPLNSRWQAQFGVKYIF